MALCAMASAILCMNAQEQTGTNAADVEKAQIPEAVEMLQTAGQLVKYGYANESALPLIQAIELYQIYASPTSGQQKDTEAEEAVAAEDGTKQSKVSYDISQLIADATTFADGDEHYLALLEEVQHSGTRGATRNYSAWTETVRAGYTDTYNIAFRGGETACVVVSGDGDTDLDLYIYDNNGNLVASDTDYTDQCVCTWTPRWTGNFKIKIKNRGRVYNRYTMAVN